MYQEDWVIRQIQNMVQMIAKLVFNKETTEYEIIDEANQTETDRLHIRLVDLLCGLKINEAENLLFESMKSGNLDYLLVAVDFYARLNEIDEADLVKNNFSRDEMESGLEEIKKYYDINFDSDMTKI